MPDPHRPSRRLSPTHPLARAVTHLTALGLVAAASALGLSAAAERPATVSGEDQSVLSFEFVAPVRAAGADRQALRSRTFELAPDPARSDPVVSRRVARFEPTPAPTPLPTPVAPPPPAPDPPAPVNAGTPKPPVASGMGLAWPVAGGTISQFFHAGHPALDIAAPYGTSVLAAQAGVVTYAGWRNNGGGYVVAVDHGNGMRTVYNHLGSIWVSHGQAVARGQAIAGVGCTGLCTGPHVHFEVVVGGSLVNPLRHL